MNKKVVIGGSLAALLVLGGGGWFGFKKYKAHKAAQAAEANKSEAQKKAEAEAKEREEEEAEVLDVHGKVVPPSVVVYKNIVNLDRKNAFLKVEFRIFVKDAELAKEMSDEKPTFESSEFKALMLSLLSGRTYEEASEVEIRESLCEEIKEKLNEKFGPKPPKPLKPGEKPKKEDPKHKKPKKPIKEVVVVDWAISS